MRKSQVDRILHTVLQKDEQLLWSGTPNPWRAHWHLVPLAAAGAVMGAAGINLWLVGAPGHVLLTLVFGALLAFAPVVAELGSCRVTYALTDRRAVVIRDMSRLQVDSFWMVDPDRLERRELLGSWGSLFFAHATDSHGAVVRQWFRCIADVRAVESLLRQRFAAESVPPAVRILRDLVGAGEPVKESAAAEELASLGEAGDQALLHGLQDADPHVHRVAAQMAGLVGARRELAGPVLAALVACRRSRLDLAYTAAATALERLGPCAVGPMIRAIQGEPDPLRAAPIAEVLHRLDPGVLARGLLDALLSQDAAACPVTRGYLEQRPALREGIVAEWAQLARTDPEPFWQMVKKRALWARLWAAEALGRSGRARDTEHLARALESPGESSLIAAVVLGRMEDARSLGRLIEALDDRYREARLAAAGALGALGVQAGAALEALERRGRADQEDQVRAACALAREQIRIALRKQPTELLASQEPAGRGTEPEAAAAPAGTGSELEAERGA